MITVGRRASFTLAHDEKEQRHGNDEREPEEVR